MEKTSDVPKWSLLSIAAAQGICLYLLYRSTELGVWPSESPLWSYPLWTLAVVVPLMLLLSIDRKNHVSAVTLVAAFGGLLLFLALYTGSQAEPHGEFPVGSMTFAYVASIGLACFKALMYLQQRADRVTLTYQVLFTNSWRNFLVGALAAVFAFIFWLILMLWGQLFRIIEIDFFHDLFTEEWFVIPALTVAFGMGVTLFRDLTRVIDNITKLLHWLIKLLLPLVIVVAIVFLGALPFTGLDLLWDTGSGTALLLWLLALILFFTNAVYQDGRETDPYPRVLHRAIYVGLCAAPIVAALAFYGLLQRIMQYGWTVERCWAFVVWLVLALFAIGYVVGIVRRRDTWTGELARVNTVMGLVVLGIMVLANSPVLDFRKISLQSQLDRVDSGEIELAEFDFWYARNHLARPAYLAMEDMKAEIGESDAELLAMIDNPVPAIAAVPIDTTALWDNMVYRPERFDVPAELRRTIELTSRVFGDADPVLIRVDPDEDGTDEYLLITVSDERISVPQFFHRNEDGWQSTYLAHDYPRTGENYRNRILNGEITLTEPRYKHVDIGGIELRPVSSTPGSSSRPEPVRVAPP